MRRLKFSEGEFYHIYNRGVDKRVIFTDPSEYRRFQAYLYLLNSQESLRATNEISGFDLSEIFTRARGEPLVSIGAYCLMPNHIHLYITQKTEGGISKFMQRLQTAYTMFFNEKHKRSGALFQGTFKAEHAGNDPYAKYIFSYIHLNPAKIVDAGWKQADRRQLKKVQKFVRGYPYSSLGEYLSGKHRVTDPTAYPEYFSSMKDIDDHVDNWLEVNNTP